MENVCDFLSRARKYGIYVLPTFGDGELPLNAYYRNMVRQTAEDYGVDLMGDLRNIVYLTEAGIKAKKHWVSEFVTFIKNRDPELLKSLLAIEFQNELYLTGDDWPFSLDSSIVTTADGRTYDMVDNDQRQACYANGINHYHTVMARAVKELDPNLMVAEGFYTLAIVGKDPNTHYGVRMKDCVNPSFPPTLPIIARSPLDFLDLHIYHVREDEAVLEAYEKEITSSRFHSPEVDRIRRQKPLIIGEFGAFKFIAPALQAAEQNMAETIDYSSQLGAQGMMMWTVDTFSQRILYHGAECSDGFLHSLVAYSPQPRD
jgi:hypothetical protein